MQIRLILISKDFFYYVFYLSFSIYFQIFFQNNHIFLHKIKKFIYLRIYLFSIIQKFLKINFY